MAGLSREATKLQGKKIDSFVQFYTYLAPTLLLHSQALAVAVVTGGFTRGVIDGYLEAQDQQ